MIIPKYFMDEILKTGSKINVEKLNINHANSILTITPIYPDSGFETRENDKNLKEMATIYARYLNHYKVKYHQLFSASFYKINEEDQGSDEIDFFKFE